MTSAQVHTGVVTNTTRAQVHIGVVTELVHKTTLIFEKHD